MPPIRKGDPNNHPALAYGGSMAQATVVDHNAADEALRPMARGELGAYQVVNPETPGFTFDVDLTASSPADVKAVWEQVNSTPNLSTHQRTAMALRLLGERQQVSRVATPTPRAAPLAAVDPFGFGGRNQSQTTPVVVAGSEDWAARSAGSYRPEHAAIPQSTPVGPPTVRVEFYLAHSRAPLPYLYHEVRVRGGWLDLITDNRYPGLSPFPVDSQDGAFVVAVEGHPTAYRCLSAENCLTVGDFTVSQLIVEERVALQGPGA